ncbi:MAG TPA: hypothetical protein VEB42_02945 [Chitinophagaceae bacterium]|nr:hypothetical protein [Chitinophagaceae bacterium]
MAKVYVNEEGEFQKDPDVPHEDLQLIESLKTYILTIYQPATSPLDADTRMSTEEIFEAFTRIYHNELFFNRNHLAKWLNQQGFKIWDAGDMRFEWLLKSVSH